VFSLTGYALVVVVAVAVVGVVAIMSDVERSSSKVSLCRTTASHHRGNDEATRSHLT
jgi:hypothetical protein